MQSALPAGKEISLTSQERSLLSWLIRGRPLEEAAAELALTSQEAQAVLERLQARLGVSGRNQLLVRAILGILR